MLILQKLLFEKVNGIVYKAENPISLVSKIRIADFL
jgi:hypothetical protein